MSDATQDQGASARARRGKGRVSPEPEPRPVEQSDEQRAQAPQLDDQPSGETTFGQVAGDSAAATGVDLPADDGVERAADIAPAPRERSFPRDRLLGPDGPQIVGHDHHVIAGALEGADGDSFTSEQVGGLVEQWLGKPVVPTNTKEA